jgi:RNA polymerase sigma-70 factor (ECF subfamily)
MDSSRSLPHLTGALDWDAVQAREPAALEQVCRRWMPSVLQWCRRLGGPTVDAEAAAQDVLLCFLERIERVRHPADLSAFLFGITRRELARHRRRAWVRRWLPGVVVEPRSLARDPEAAAVDADTMQTIQAIVSELPAALAEVWVLAEVEQRPLPEVADLLAVNEGTLRTRLRSARTLVRQKATLRGLSAPESK